VKNRCRRRQILRAVAFALSCSCLCCHKDASLWKIENLNGNRISVLGHEGMGIYDEFPLCSYESLNKCLSAGAAGVETDLQMTKDSVLVMYHDDDLSDQTTCSGRIRDRNFSEIKDCDFSTGPAGHIGKVVPVSFFLDHVNDPRKYIFDFECKLKAGDDPQYTATFANALCHLLNKYGLTNRCFVESYNVDFLIALQKREPGMKLFLYTSSYTTGISYLNMVKLFGLVIDMNKIGADEIKEAHQRGLRVTLFNASTVQKNIEAIKKNPDFIQTDQVEYLVRALKE
jgi:glycerophosphoryl diester phosphodiesterase